MNTKISVKAGMQRRQTALELVVRLSVSPLTSRQKVAMFKLAVAISVLLLATLFGCGKNTKTIVAPAPLPFKNVRDFGAKGDGTSDDTGPINAALAAGGDIYVPAGTYRVTSSLYLTTATTFRGAGRGVSTIHMTTAGTGFTISAAGDNIVIADLAFQGPSPNDTYTAKETAIRVGPAVPSVLACVLQIRNCSIFNYGSHGMEIDSVSIASIENNNIHRVGYAGIACLSSYDVVVSGNTIQTIKPGFQGDAYGIQFSHWHPLLDPPCSRCIANGNTIRDIPVWEGLDTHDGNFITFSNNIVEGCKLGIHAATVDGAPVVHDIAITGNTVVAGSAAQQHYGIVLGGILDDAAYNLTVTGNVVDGYGMLGNPNMGAIGAFYTRALVVTGNVVEHFSEAGIVFQLGNTTFNCSGNLVNSGTATSGPAYAISVPSHPNSGLITGNYLSGNSIYVNPNASNHVTVSDNH
jgi:hypothetical protein